jgi:hypothetical protein
MTGPDITAPRAARQSVKLNRPLRARGSAILQDATPAARHHLL